MPVDPGATLLDSEARHLLRRLPASGTWSATCLIRGGSNATGTEAGVFALGGSNDVDFRADNVGFRCGR